MFYGNIFLQVWLYLLGWISQDLNVRQQILFLCLCVYVLSSSLDVIWLQKEDKPLYTQTAAHTWTLRGCIEVSTIYWYSAFGVSGSWPANLTNSKVLHKSPVAPNLFLYHPTCLSFIWILFDTQYNSAPSNGRKGHVCYISTKHPHVQYRCFLPQHWTHPFQHIN